jgi:DNA-directed RNA polymerase beta' subunit
MNMHVPQSVEAAIELREIASVAKQMISPRLSKPLVSVVQDTLVGVNRLTRPTEFFTRREFMNLLIHSKRWDGVIPPPAKRDPVPLWSGRQVVSALLPAVFLKAGNKKWKDAMGRGDQNYVVINGGKIEQGILDGDTFDKGLIHILYNDFSPEATVDFIDGLQAVVATYLQNSGFSVGLSDIVADTETLSTISTDMETLKKRIEALQLQVHMGLFDNTSGRSNQEEFEGKVFQTLDKMVELAGQTGLASLPSNNRMVNMIACGSKGSNVNIAQMIATLGQQSIEGKRIGYGFQDRTLPHFKRYDDGAEARGFIESSFVKGLSPSEFYFHAMTGREGLIDTAVKTADSGYMQRQLVKAMEDLMVFHDGSVRDAGGLVVQFSYGDDGTSATKIENQPIALGEMSDSEINGKFAVADAAPEASQAHLAAVFEDRDMLVRNVWGGRVDKTVQSAVHLPRLIANAVQQLGLRSDSAEGKELVNGGHVLDTIQRIIQQTNSKNRLWAALLRYHLNPRGLQGLGFTRAAFDWLAEQIVVKHMKSWVVPGEMSGIIAAQSLGEPTTQMSSVASTVVTIGKISGPTSSVTSYFTGKVGSFIDKLMSENAAAVRLTGHGPESKVLDISPEYVILGVSNDEKTSWKPISQVSRHPANGGLVTVTTKSGRKTTATLTHSFLKRTTTGIAEVKGSDLEIGQRIPVACRIPESPIGLSTFKGFALTKEFGWLVGIYLADGSLSGNSVKITKIHPIVEERIRTLAPTYGWTVTTRHYKGAYGPSKETVINNKQLKDVLLELGGKGSYDKFISSHIFHAKRDFIAGVLSGYFDGDGNVNVTRQQIRVGSRSETLIRDIARLLGYCGVFAAIKQETSIRIPGAVMYTANIIRKHAAQFEKIIGLTLPEKAAALTQIVAYNDRADFHSQKEELDMIPELGEVIAETGRLLKMPGASRTYGRWVSKAAIGRRTLERYIGDFLDMMKVHVDPAVEMQVKRNIAILESARQADVIWDEIVALDYQEDPHELVYDFTVPGNDSFMVDDNIFVHNTLNTFHLSGVAAKSGMTRGVPRLKELLKVTPNIRASSLTIYLRPDLRSSKEAARKLAQELEFTMLKDLVTVSRIYFDPRDADTLIAEDKEWLSFFADFEQSEEKAGVTKSPWIMRLELNREKMFNKNITMEDVHFMIRKYNGETDVTYTDHNAGRLIFRIRPTASGKDLDDLAAIKQMQTKLLTSVLVRGLPGLKAVTFRKVTDESFTKNPEKDNKYEATEQYVLDTLGSNFLDVMIHPNVDGLKLLSNHVHDIYENLGIEAARQVLFKEIFTLFEQAAPVNCRHVALLCDAICNRGRMMPADRNGVNKKKSGPLAKASFEQTGEIMLKAAIFGEMDPVTGVAANIMTGQPIRGGTSFTPMLLDEAAMLEFIASAPPPKRTIERAPTLVQQEIDRLLEADDTAPGCRQQDLRIPAALPSGPVDSTPMELPDMEIVLVDD